MRKKNDYDHVQRADIYSYTSAVLANEINITPEGLRYYEKKGAANTVRVEENGYRKYQPQETVVLRMVRILNAYGFGIAEAIDMVTDGAFTNEELIKLMREKEKALIEKIRHKQQILSKLQEGINDLTHFSDSSESTEIWFERRPAFHYLYYKTGLYAYKDKQLNALMQRWMQLMPVAYPMPVLLLKDYQSTAQAECNDPFVGGGIAIHADDLPDETYLHKRYCRYYPERDYLCTTSYQTQPDGVTLQEEKLQRALVQVDAMRLCVDGDIFFKSVFAEEHSGKIGLDYKVYIPVRPR